MKPRILRAAAAGVLAGLIAVAGPLSAAHAATVPAYDTTTDAPVWVIDGLTYAEYTDKQIELPWGYQDGVYLSGVSAPTFEGDTTPYQLERPTADADHWRSFIATPGQERTRSAWGAWGDPVPFLNGNGPEMPQITPEYQSFGTPANIKAVGGTYSLGVAYLDSLDKDVIAAYYVTINVDAGTGNWKFSTPPAPVEKEDTTTTVVASDDSIRVGDTVTLTGTVSPSEATGNVQFFAGSTSLGTGALAAGQAVLTTTAVPEGAASITAVYSGDDDYSGSTSPAVTVSVSQVPIPDSNDLPETSPTAITVETSGLNATIGGLAAFEGQRVNVFGFSEGTFLGRAVVTGGSVSVSLNSLPAGEHTIAVYSDDDDSLIGFLGNVEVGGQAEDSPQDIPVHAVVRTSVDGAFQLVVPTGTEATIGDPELDPSTGESVSTGDLPAFTVIDDRIISHRGWTLTSTVDQFEDDKGNTIENTAFGLNPNVVDSLDASEYGDTVAPANLGTPVAGPEQVAGTAVYASTFAELEAGKFNPLTTLDADLSFRAPIGKPAGTYDSTLTLTLVSK